MANDFITFPEITLWKSIASLYNLKNITLSLFLWFYFLNLFLSVSVKVTFKLGVFHA